MSTTTSREQWKLTIVPGPAEVAHHGADRVVVAVRHESDLVLSVPTGSTPLGMFDALAQRSQRGDVDFSHVELFCLDEYVGLTVEDPNSLTAWLMKAFAERVGIAASRVHTLPATDDDLAWAARSYEASLTALGGLDLAVLGLGPNGHVAYNEPGSAADSRTRVVDLTAESIAQASAYWHNSVPIPSTALTIGIATLLEARHIVLLVTGQAKAEILRLALAEPMSANVPASWMRRAGPRLEIIADEAAADRLAQTTFG